MFPHFGPYACPLHMPNPALGGVAPVISQKQFGFHLAWGGVRALWSCWLLPLSTHIYGGDTTHGCIYPSPRRRSQDAGCRLARQSFPTGQDCTYLAGDTQEIDSRMGSRMSKLKEISEDMQSSNSQFIFNLKTLSSKGKFMQSPSLYIDKS